MGPKYRHRGYKDKEFEERDRGKPPPRQDLTPEERIHRRGLRHAIDREAHAIVRCHNCGRNLQNLAPITSASTCPNCSTPLHCCRTCQYFDSGARWQCKAEIEEPVSAKNDNNNCPKYEPRKVLDVTGRRSQSTRGSNDPRSQFDDLFKR